MRQLLFASLSFATLALAGCGGGGPGPDDNASANAVGGRPAAELYAITAGPITGNRNAGINSSFTIRRSDTGIESDRYGGACIIFRASDLGYDEIGNKVCSSDTDCQNSKGPGYCDTGSRQCWARPSVPAGTKDPFCNRSIDYSPQRQWDDGEHNWISAQPIPVPEGLKPNAQARTLALLRAKAGVNPPGVSTWGNARTIP